MRTIVIILAIVLVVPMIIGLLLTAYTYYQSYKNNGLISFKQPTQFKVNNTILDVSEYLKQ